ncbi:hypothetical protein CK203_075385 [Vitis vinifera]|uniref:Integrase catalytic domain-containing protein n=1 Tax=Vitis vinifera TaxID=29760 RepID=A0A438BXL3_VITVI|nr:hypothetical protein CK203_075385 [Vitis vinifera]
MVSGSRVGLILQSPIGELMEQAIHLNFSASNNEAEYEAVLVGLDLALILAASKLETRKERLKRLGEWIIKWVPREKNGRDDVLAEIVAILPINETIMLPIYLKATPSITLEPVCNTSQADLGWMLNIIKYLQIGEVSEDGKQTHKLRIQATRFTLSDDHLYRRSFGGLYLKYLSELEAKYVLDELHEGWMMDIVDLLPIGVAQKKLLLVAIDYFNKWVKTKAYDNRKDKDVFNVVFRTFCLELNIKNLYLTPRYPQNNKQEEATNKTLLNALRKRLEGAKGKWVDELLGILWAYRTTSRWSMTTTPFILAYGMEAIIPTKIGMPTTKIAVQDQMDNDEELIRQLDWADEMRGDETIWIASYH